MSNAPAFCTTCRHCDKRLDLNGPPILTDKGSLWRCAITHTEVLNYVTGEVDVSARYCADVNLMGTCDKWEAPNA